MNNDKPRSARFWLVWNPNGRNPQFMHANFDSVRLEAQRLARLNPGQRFYMVEVIGYAEVQDPLKTEIFK